MTKIGGTDAHDARPLKVNQKLLEDLRSILRGNPTGEQTPPLQLSLEFLKEELGKIGHKQILGDRIALAFQELQQQGIITLQEPVRAGGWTVTKINPNI